MSRYILYIVAILSPFKCGDIASIKFPALHYSIGVGFAVISIIFNLTITFILSERRVGFKSERVAYECFYEQEITSVQLISYVAIICCNKWTLPSLPSYVLASISLIYFIYSNKKRNYESDYVESLTMALRINRLLLGGCIVAMRLLSMEISYSTDCLLLMSIISSACISHTFIMNNEKYLIKTLHSIWGKGYYNSDDLISSICIMDRIIRNKDVNRSRSIWFQGFIHIHYQMCTDANCPLTKVVKSLQDPTIIFRDLNSFLQNYFKSVHKMITYFFMKNSTQYIHY